VTRAFKYLRISDDPEGLEAGVTRQDEDTDRLAERLGAEVLETFVDNDVSASTLSTKPRDNYERMMRLAPQVLEPGDVILAYSNSRLTRRPREWEEILDLHVTNGIEVHTWVSGSIDLSTADGRAMARTLAAWDAAEAERISERTKRANLQKAERGLPHGGLRAFGWADDKRTPIPREQEIQREIVKRVIEGESPHLIGKDLDRRGIKTVTGAKWSRASIRAMVTSPRMIGMRVNNGALYPAVWSAVIDELTWRHAKAVLGGVAPKGSNARVSLLAGIARCGECGGAIRMKSGSTRTKPRQYILLYTCKVCRISRQRDAIDYYVERTIVHILEQGLSPVGPGGSAAMERVDALRAKIAATQALYAESDSLTPQQFEATMRTLNRRLTAEEAKLFPPRPLEIAGDLMGAQAEARWQELPLDAKRKIVGELAEVRILRGPKGRRPFDPDTVLILPR
jgi:DNA invertase Pin-like site-specific DNA recombinase